MRFVPEIRVTEWVNAHLPRDGAAAYLAFLGSRGLYWQVRYTYDDSFLAGTLLDAVRNSATSGDVAVRLRQRGIGFVAVAVTMTSRFMRDNLSPEELERWRGFVGDHLTLLFRDGGISLYAVDGALAPALP